MLDEKDLQAIAQLMDSKMAQQKKEIISETMVLMEAYFDPKFQALKEEIAFLNDIIRMHTNQINDLKKAQ